MSAIVIQADTRSLPLPDESVDLIVTSPPYFALRSYTDDGEHYAGQVGSEPTWQEFIAALVECTREWVRVLKPSGSLFVDLGDKYASSGGAQRQGGAGAMADRSVVDARAEAKRRGIGEKAGREDGGFVRNPAPDMPNKSLMLLPERYRIACVDVLGLIARAVICWSKPNGLPESVTDRVRRSHEDWVHLTKRPRYYSAVDEIRQPYSAKTMTTVNSTRDCASADAESGHAGHRKSAWAAERGVTHGEMMNPLGALPGSVWTIPTEPLKLPDHLGVDHFAAFPSEWPRRLILGWSPPGICVECGEGRRPVVDTPKAVGHVKPKTQSGAVEARGGVGASSQLNMSGSALARWRDQNPATITGYACDCPTPDAPTTPAVVLDPCGGTGTTGAVASALGRTGISIDLSHDYSRVAVWRSQDTALAGKVQGRMWKERQTTLDLGGAA